MFAAGLGLPAGLRGAAHSRWAIVGLPAAWLTGGVIGLVSPEVVTLPWLTTLSIGVVGILVALNATMPRVVSLRAQWSRVVVRVAGSWIAAIGLLMLGWLVKGKG